MNYNPYQAPQSYQAPQGPQFGSDTPPPDRTNFVLAAGGAWLASAYWAVLTLLILAGTVAGRISAVQIILPAILIFLYAQRGLQIFRGNRAAARRILWLHGFGAVSAVLQIASGGAVVFVLQGIKILIHIFGAVFAYLVQKNL